jgi:hypothetical protein
MRSSILCLVLALIVAVVALIDVPKSLEGLAEVGAFAVLVVFVVLMVRYLAEDR